MARFLTNYFKGTVVKLCEKIVDKLSEEKDLQDDMNKRKEDYEKSDYNSNVYREIIPVLKNTDYNLDKEICKSRKGIEREINKLNKQLDKINDKADKMTEALTFLSKAPFFDKCTVNYLPATRTIVLYSNEQTSRNSIFILDEKNNVNAYKNVEELYKKNPTFKTLKNFDEKDFIEVCSKGKILSEKDSVTEVVNNMYNKIAEKLENDINRKNIQLAGQNIQTKLENLEKLHSDEIFYDTNNGIVEFYHPTGDKIQISLDNSAILFASFVPKEKEEIISDKPIRIYDISDSSKGFLNVNNDSFKEIVNCDVFKTFMSEIANMELQEHTEKYKYHKSQDIQLGKREYHLEDVGVTQVPNHTFSYDYDNSKKLTKKMLNIAEDYKKAVPDDVEVHYNEYNNTINLTNKGFVVSLAFDEKANLQDIYSKYEAYHYIQAFDVIYEQGEINKAGLEHMKNPIFKHITQNLNFDDKSITRGEIGTIKQEPKMTLADKLRNKLSKNKEEAKEEPKQQQTKKQEDVER